MTGTSPSNPSPGGTTAGTFVSTIDRAAMNFTVRFALLPLLLLLLVHDAPAQSPAPSRWVTGYVASWTLYMGPGTDGNYGHMPYDAIDLDALTHVVMFAVAVKSDGSIKFNNLVPSRRKKFNDHVHSKGKPVLLSMGGAGNDEFSAALQREVRPLLVKNLLDIVRSEQYDGVDIDIEGFRPADTANLAAFISELHAALQQTTAYYDRSKRPIMTAAVYNVEQFWAGVSRYFDQINLMSYDFFGTWFGTTWHNNAPYGGPNDVDKYGAPMTTVQSKMNRFLKAGIPKEKFGVGVDFNGYVWRGGLLADGSGNGVTGPRQRWSQPPKNVYGKELPYHRLKKEYIDPAGALVRYDAVAKVPYIGFDSTGNERDHFVTYQDTSTVREIIALAARSNIGGVIVWEVGGGYLGEKDFPAASLRPPMRDPLLQAVKSAARTYFVPSAPPVRK